MTVQFKCDCTDNLCPVHIGSECKFGMASNLLHRDDMCSDPWRLPYCPCTYLEFCDACTDDAIESGVFSIRGEKQ